MDAREFNRLLRSYKYDQGSVERLYSYFYARIVKHLNARYSLDVARAATEELFLQLFLIDVRYFVRKPAVWMYTEAERIAATKGEKRRKPPAPEALKMLVSEESFSELHEVLIDLDDESRRIIEMIYWEGYNQKEIADLLGIEHDAVRKKHSRILKRIKDSLKKL